jgi:hypothetical protein
VVAAVDPGALALGTLAPGTLAAALAADADADGDGDAPAPRAASAGVGCGAPSRGGRSMEMAANSRRSTRRSKLEPTPAGVPLEISRLSRAFGLPISLSPLSAAAFRRNTLTAHARHAA